MLVYIAILNNRLFMKNCQTRVLNELKSGGVGGDILYINAGKYQISCLAVEKEIKPKYYIFQYA